MTTYEETGCGNVSESTGCHSVVTLSRWHSTAKGPMARNCEPLAWFRNSEDGAKLALSDVRKQPWIFKQFLGCILGPLREKCKFCHQGSMSRLTLMVYPHISKKFPHRPRLIRFLLQRWKQWWYRHLDVGLPFPVSVGTFPMVSGSGNFKKKMTSKQAFSSMCVTQHTVCWESCLLSRQVRHQQRECFQASI